MTSVERYFFKRNKKLLLNCEAEGTDSQDESNFDLSKNKIKDIPDEQLFRSLYKPKDHPYLSQIINNTFKQSK